MTIDAAGWRVPEWTRGDRLRKARELTGLGQEAFGDETGISRRSISDYEGDKAVPRKPVMMAWAFRTGVPLEWLETGATPQGDPRDVVDGMMRVTGKGGRVRVVPIHRKLRGDLETWITETGDGYLFPGQTDGHLAPQTVGTLLSQLLGPGWTAHTLRHRFATRSYDGSGDLLAVQQLLGHAKPETTMRYVRLNTDRLRAAVQAA